MFYRKYRCKEMNNSRTIVEAIKIVLESCDRDGLTCQEVYSEIVKQKLYKFGAKDPKAAVQAKLRTHCVGLDFPTASPVKFFRVTKRVNTTNYYGLKKTENNLEECVSSNVLSEDMLHEETIKASYDGYLQDLRKTILDKIKNCHPAFFEQLVVDLLIKMGYGYDSDSGKVVGGSHDGGIDGIVSEDKLGLSLIYIQAKRYSKNKIGSKEIQAFVGAMKNIQKGVFITTSTFTAEAKKFTKEQQQKNLKLIDGTMLSELMVKYQIGLEVVEQYPIYKINEDYYSE